MSAAAGKSASPRYADWKAPAEDSRLLIWPEIDELLRQTEQNHNLLAAAAAPRLLGVPLNELRRQARAWIGAIDPQQPIVATGHQTELYHPGVWIKDAVIHFAAERIGGTAWHLAVDTDAPKHLLLRWPGGAMAISDDSRLATAAWSGLLDPPTPAHLAQLRQALHSAAEKMGFEPSALKVLEDMARLALQPTTLSEVLCNVLHGLDWSLGLRHHALLFSPLCLSPPYLSFAASVLADARRFASHYNQALREYRQEQSISGTMRPMPDLFIGPDAVEVPFWLDNLALGTRSRPSVFEECGGTILKLVSGEEFRVDSTETADSAATRLARFLGGTGHRLSPRALTLTMFLRLFLADQFVHGIGGGRYDQVLDRLITRYFGIEPPRFAVATATMFLPTALSGPRVCLPCVLAEGRRLRHGALGSRKMEYVRRIESLPRHSRERALTFAQMQADLRSSWQGSEELARWQQRLQETRAAAARQAVELDRELFYAMQPMERLATMVDRVRDRFGGR